METKFVSLVGKRIGTKHFPKCPHFRHHFPTMSSISREPERNQPPHPSNHCVRCAMTFAYRPVAWSCSFAVLLVLAVTALAKAPEGKEAAKPSKWWVFIGTYTGDKSKSKGIYRCELDLETGKLSAPELAAETASPSFLAIAPNNRFLYAVGENDGLGDKKTG